MLDIVMLALVSMMSCRVLQQTGDYLKLQLLPHSNTFSYTVSLFVGNPPQQQLLKVDTINPYLLIKESSCLSCTQPYLPSFNKAASTSYSNFDCQNIINTKKSPQYEQCLSLCKKNFHEKKNQCRFSIDYIKKKSLLIFNGDYGKDQVRFSYKIGSKQTRSTIGAIQSQIGLFGFEENGFLGVSVGYQISLMFDWFRQKKLDPSAMKLGLCFQKKRGYMEWGNIRQPAVTTKYDYKSKLYKIFVDEISIGNKNILDNLTIHLHNGITIDTAHTSCIFPFKQREIIAQMINAKCKQISFCSPTLVFDVLHFFQMMDSKCYKLNSFGHISFEAFLNSKFEEIKIKINGSYFNMRPSQYLYVFEEDNIGNKIVCLAITTSFQNQYILGMPWILNKKIVFSLDPLNPTISILDNYTCFHFVQQLLNKLSKGWIGYLIVSSLLFLMLNSQQLYKKIRRQNKKVNIEQSQLYKLRERDSF